MKIIKSYHYHIITIFFFLAFNLHADKAGAQLTFNNGATAQQLAQTIAGPGVQISNAVLNCPPDGQ